MLVQNVRIKNDSLNFQHLFESCIKLKPTERPTIGKIKEIISNQIIQFTYLEDYLSIDTQIIKTFQIVQLVFESLIIFKQDHNNLKKYI